MHLYLRRGAHSVLGPCAKKSATVRHTSHLEMIRKWDFWCLVKIMCPDILDCIILENFRNSVAEVNYWGMESQASWIRFTGNFETFENLVCTVDYVEQLIVQCHHVKFYVMQYPAVLIAQVPILSVRKFLKLIFVHLFRELFHKDYSQVVSTYVLKWLHG